MSTFLSRKNDRIYYCLLCFNSSDLFGCVGLRNAQYCIFNTQYTKQEYERIVAHIIEHMQETGEWGVFFDTSLSPFAYNETIAQERYPLDKTQALQHGFSRQDKNVDPTIPAGVETLSGDQIPTNTGDIDDSILKKIFVCEVSGRPFRLVKQELDFYRQHNLPLPRKHPDIRYQERYNKKPKRNMYLRTCDKSGEEILSVYPQDVDFKVYSEEEYEQEVFG